MNKEQFRYGNLCQDQNGNLLKVCKIDDNDVVFTVVDRSKFPLPDGWQAEGIPITEDWLQNFGFVKLGSLDFFYIHNDVMNLKISEDLKMIAWYNMAIHNVDIGFIHQLQNLFFALTGSELQIQGTEKIYKMTGEEISALYGLDKKSTNQ